MKNNKKKLFILVSAVLLTVIILISPAVKSKTQSYYSGDAINYKHEIIIGSVNSGKLELFKLQNNKIIKTTNIQAVRNIALGKDNFSDLIFNQENNKLYIYLTGGRFLYKYNISDLYHPQLVKQVKNNSWNWLLKLDKFENNIVTVSNQKIKVWNHDMQIINEFDLKTNTHDSIKFSNKGSFIFNFHNNIFNIINADSRQTISSVIIPTQNNNLRRIYNDAKHSRVYIMSDKDLKQISFDGRYKRLQNIKNNNFVGFGYDVDGLDDQKYLYFSDGMGVTKVDKNNLNILKYVNTTNITENNGWAMGLRVIDDYLGEKIVIFNNSCIIILDNNLNLIDSYKSTEQENRILVEKLFLNINTNKVFPGMLIKLSGGGYGLNEDLIITFAGEIFTNKADNNGKFNAIIKTPNIKPTKTDIKVIGKLSGLSYSVGVEIIKN